MSASSPSTKPRAGGSADVRTGERRRAAPCPICNVHLRSLQAGLDTISARGASLVAISPQAPDDSLGFAERLESGFDVLSDLDQTVIKEWGLQFELPEALRDVYRAMNMDLEVNNADGSWHLPVPATFVLDPSGVVLARHVDPNYRERMALDEVLAALDAMTSVGNNRGSSPGSLSHDS